MAQLIVRNIGEEVKARLKRRAKKHGRSMEEEAREILRGATGEGEVSTGRLGSEIAALFAKAGLDEEIQELRGCTLKPPQFRR